MTRLWLLPYRDLKKVMEAMGFEWVRCEGSQNIFRHSNGKIVVILDYGNQVII